MRYEEPNMRVLMLEAEDIITLSIQNGEISEEDSTLDTEKVPTDAWM